MEVKAIVICCYVHMYMYSGIGLLCELIPRVYWSIANLALIAAAIIAVIIATATPAAAATASKLPVNTPS